MFTAASNILSFRRAIFCTSGPNRLLRIPEPDVPQRVGKHGCQDESEIEAAGDPGYLVWRQAERTATSSTHLVASPTSPS
jgi:hypothetical protein